jgi:isoquinoline 1-oxidoreductase beta subunit
LLVPSLVAVSPNAVRVPSTLMAWLKLLPDNDVRIIMPYAEMGQGAQAALSMMLADEMDADWPSVSVEEAPAHDE